MATQKRKKLTLDQVETQMEVLTKEEMNALKGGTDDIIVLFDKKAVNGFGHTAVLIGDDVNGYRYYSSNGTGEGKLWGTNKEPDTGEQKYNNLGDFIKKFGGDYNYTKFVRIQTTSEEDAIAHDVAKSVAGEKFYSIFGSSCIDVPQEVIKEVFKQRGLKVKGDNILIPNRYLKFLIGNEYGSEEYYLGSSNSEGNNIEDYGSEKYNPDAYGSQQFI